MGWFAAARMQLRLLHTERGPESSPAKAALALAASKSRAIRYNSLKAGKKGVYILHLLAMRLGKAGKPCLGAQSLPLWRQTSVVPCLTLLMGPTCSCLAAGCDGTAASRERGSGSPSPRGNPTVSPRWRCPYCSHSQILIPGLAPCPPDLGGTPWLNF